MCEKSFFQRPNLVWFRVGLIEIYVFAKNAFTKLLQLLFTLKKISSLISERFCSEEW